MSARFVTLLASLCLLLLAPSGRATDSAPALDYPHERAKDLSTVYGRYEIYEAVKYRGSFRTTAAEAQAWVGQELMVTAALFHALGDRIENPTYTVWYYPSQTEGVVVPKSEWWSSMYGLSDGQAGGDEVIKVYKPGGSAPWLNLEPIGTNELWTRFDGWYYKSRKTARPVLSPGHEDYCQVMGPCSTGQGDCDSDSECQSGLSCVDDVGATYGWDAEVDVCTTPPVVVPPNLRGAVDVVSQLNSAPLTLYGWAYNQSDTAANIPVEIYVGGVRGTGTLAATITADQPRPDVNTDRGITGDHGYEWPVPASYQSSAQDFYVYALDQSPNPTVRTQLNQTPLRLLEPGHLDYCKNHGPCSAGQGDCEPGECQSGLTCADGGGWLYGWGASVDVCQASTGSTVHLGHMNYCKDHGPCAAGQGDCDNDAECQSGLRCVDNVGRNYGWGRHMDVCEATTPPGGTTTQTQSIYRLATSTPSAPSGGTSTEQHVPSGWSTTQPRPTNTQGVYRSQRTVTYQGNTFQSATTWGAPTRVAAPLPRLLGAVDLVSQLNSDPLTLYGWAYNQADTAATIPVEIYVGGARGTGTLAATITADQPRPDVNTDRGITGDHGYEWPVPASYQSSAQDFYVYALDQSPNPTVRTQLNLTPLRLLALGHADYCKNHGPCSADQGDCENGECQSGLICVHNVGETYGWGAAVDVCRPSTAVHQTTQAIYRRATSAPSAPSGGTSTEHHVPSGWSTTQPSPTNTQGVYRSQRTVTYRGSAFQSATAWGTPTRVAAPLPRLLGAVDLVSQLNSAPLTLYGWAFNQSDTAANIPVEIYVGGVRGTGTLAATITADQPRPDVNTAHSITGDHGYEWPVPTQYQSSAQDFYVYALDQSPSPTVRTQLNQTPLRLLAPGHYDYCKNHGPCSADQGDCENGECQSGLSCTHNVGRNYGWGRYVDVCQSSTPPGRTTTQTQAIYRRATSAPSAPSGGTSTEHHVPSGWSTTQPSPTNTQGVYRSQRTVTYRGSAFQSATAWGTPTRVAAPTRPTVNVGHYDYCRDYGPCSAGQGDCDNAAECQSGLSCVDNVGRNYGWRADVDVCEAPVQPVCPRWLSQPSNLGPNTNPPPRVGSGNWAGLDFAHLVTGESPTGWSFRSSNESVAQITQNNGSSMLRLRFLRAGSSRITATASKAGCSSVSRTLTITVSP